MGVDVNVYLGPIVKVKVKQKNVTNEINCCTNVACERHVKRKQTDTKFCTDCGSAVSKQKIATTQDFDPFYGGKEWNDIFCTVTQDKHIIFLPNFYFEDNIPAYTSSERFDQTEYRVDNIDFNAVLNHYKTLQKVKDLMILLKDDYSDDEIVVSYSLVQYCS